MLGPVKWLHVDGRLDLKPENFSCDCGVTLAFGVAPTTPRDECTAGCKHGRRVLR